MFRIQCNRFCREYIETTQLCIMGLLYAAATSSGHTPSVKANNCRVGGRLGRIICHLLGLIISLSLWLLGWAGVRGFSVCRQAMPAVVVRGSQRGSWLGDWGEHVAVS